MPWRLASYRERKVRADGSKSRRRRRRGRRHRQGDGESDELAVHRFCGDIYSTSRFYGVYMSFVETNRFEAISRVCGDKEALQR